MKDLRLRHQSGNLHGKIQITGSKSESNRMLLLKALFPQISLANVSNSDDTVAMKSGLETDNDLVDIGHAGTSMRFLTAYYSSLENQEKTLTGSPRMQERPIGILVDALRQLGADISYLKNEGYPPVLIKGKRLTASEVCLSANISSQYITALMLIAPSLPDGLCLHLEGKITSVPYIEMTLSLLHQIGVKATFSGQRVQVFPKNDIAQTTHDVESDWSSASYYFSMVALAQEADITLSTYKENSLQGDKVLMDIYEQLGVKSMIKNNTLYLQKQALGSKPIQLDLSDAPDIAQTIAVTCYGLGIACDLTGLHTLKIKETDRLVALQNELTKLGATIEITDKSLHLQKRTKPIHPNILIETYHDHRMAMAFAPLALLVPIRIQDADVVTKSYPGFWEDLEKNGYSLGS
ncbi:MAG: 3-phosphoshikimate 1-carboxyvinyltransferase [Flavobacteriaceae bacterium TMED81]|nr:MAG: 3-phosphoshikimate 1-carboxyvinyltransferase [Flavobacteriaceae bacterium TMED81]|tara:strand:- start:1305 stop:2528 length:1224 start_codon:yes stop_codon:yes gene_type:complete